MKITNQFIYVTEEACKAIARIDLNSGAVSNDASYPNVNCTTYFCLINVWANLVGELSHENAYNLICAIKKDGLLAVIKQCQQFSDDIIKSLDDIVTIPEGALFMLQGCSDITQVLMLLRFPKRFSPLKANLVEASSIRNFLSINNEMKMKQHYELNNNIISRVRDVVSDMLKGFTFDVTDGYFAPGAFVGKPKINKNLLVNKVLNWPEVEWFHPLYPASAKVALPHDKWYYTAEVRTVPKSYKAARIIAKENSYRQWCMQAVRVSLERALKDNGYSQYIDFADQGHNQFFCYLGSVSDSYATADLSAASDRISCSLMRSLLPTEVLKLTDEYRSDYFSVSGKEYTTQMYNTSGAALTFCLESIVFTAILIAVTQYVELLIQEVLSKPRVFGDDILVDPRAYDTLVEWLTKLGLVMNLDKSYTLPSRYRESCGVEFFDGCELTQFYFPRKTLNFDIDYLPITIESIISLEKRLYDHWAARSFLIEFVRNFYPAMTSSYPLSDNDDLWEPYPLFKERYLIPNVEYTKREGHFSLKQTFPPIKDANKIASKWALDNYYYQQSLIHGPSYLGKLEAILGISVSRCQYQRDTQDPSYRWSLRW